MREVTEQEYREFIKGHDRITVDGKAVKLVNGATIKLFQPEEFQLEKTTVWSFENRGSWATHQGNYRGNWAPEIPRNLILRYTEPGYKLYHYNQNLLFYNGIIIYNTISIFIFKESQ